MNETRDLLAAFARTRDEAAFRELVARYVNLVYSTAIRSVGGDTQLAEDVTQTVFIHLAQQAGKLARESQLGGWLHRDACFTASKARRGEHRRRAREQEAVAMHAANDDSNANLEAIAPILDDAINRLREEDRSAILLRFYEERDFRAVGAALGASEDAARMRVARALDRLRAILKQRGAVVSAAALTVLLSTKAVTAAPAPLAAKLAGAALVSSAAGSGITLLKIMSATSLKTAVAATVAIGAIVTAVFVKHNADARQQAQDALLRDREAQLAQLTADNTALSNQLHEAQSSGGERTTDLARLRSAVAKLRDETNRLARLNRETARAAVTPSKSDSPPADATPLHIQKMNFQKNLALAFLMYANDHTNQFPKTFDEAASYLPDSFTTNNTISPDLFDITFQGARTDLTSNANDVLLFREKDAWQNPDGTNWLKVYGYADGHVEVMTIPATRPSPTTGQPTDYESFEAFEKDHIVPPAGQ